MGAFPPRGARIAFQGSPGAALEAALLVPETHATERLPTVLLVLDSSTSREAACESACGELVRAGFAVLTPIPETDAPLQSEEELDERRALAALDKALAWLGARDEVDRERLAALGIAAGATLAFQLACTSRRLAAVVSCGGALVHRELSRARPIQPLELALNLGCPALFLFGERDPATPREHVELLERTLSQFMKSFEIERLAGAGSGFLDPASAGYHAPAARRAWEHCALFLREHTTAS